MDSKLALVIRTNESLIKLHTTHHNHPKEDFRLGRAHEHVSGNTPLTPHPSKSQSLTLEITMEAAAPPLGRAFIS